MTPSLLRSLFASAFLILLSVSLTIGQTIVYVTSFGAGNQSGSSWNNALPGVQLRDQLASAAANTEFWLASGTYKPTTGIDRGVSFTIPSGVQVYGGFQGNESQLTARQLTQPSSTTLSGDIGVAGDVSDNSESVVLFSKSTNETLLNGVVVAYAATEGVVNSSNSYLTGSNQSSYVTISNCYFSNNNRTAVANYASYGPTCSMTIVNSVFINNGNASAYTAGAISNGSTTASKAYMDISSCIFKNNVGGTSSGAILNSSFEFGTSRITLRDCLFDGNSSSKGAAIFNTNYSGTVETRIERSYFYNNQAIDGGVALMSSGQYSGNILEFKSCLIRNNRAVNGGVVNTTENGDANNLKFTNCTILNNSASAAGGVLFSQSTGATGWVGVIKSSIIRGNFSPDQPLFKNNNTITSATYSNIQGGFAGTGNIDADPLFIDAANSNYRLQANSPSVNTGDPNTTTSEVGPVDLAGNPRIDNGRIDMGAYERQTVVGPLVTVQNGNWNDPATWQPQRVPGAGDAVLIRHRVALPVSYTANVGQVQYDANGQVIFSPAAQIKFN